MYEDIQQVRYVLSGARSLFSVDISDGYYHVPFTVLASVASSTGI